MATERMDVLTMRRDEKTDKTYWTRVGVAFPAKEGKGWNIQLDALPVNGKLVLREPKQYEDRNKGGKEDDQIPF